MILNFQTFHSLTLLPQESLNTAQLQHTVTLLWLNLYQQQDYCSLVGGKKGPQCY